MFHSENQLLRHFCLYELFVLGRFTGGTFLSVLKYVCRYHHVKKFVFEMFPARMSYSGELKIISVLLKFIILCRGENSREPQGLFS